MTNLVIRWTQHIPEKEEKEKFAKSVLSSLPLRRLKQILLEELEALDRPTEADYESPSWAYLQAHRNGRVQQIRSLLTMLEPIKT